MKIYIVIILYTSFEREYKFRTQKQNIAGMFASNVFESKWEAINDKYILNLLSA